MMLKAILLVSLATVAVWGDQVYGAPSDTPAPPVEAKLPPHPFVIAPAPQDTFTGADAKAPDSPLPKDIVNPAADVKPKEGGKIAKPENLIHHAIHSVPSKGKKDRHHRDRKYDFNSPYHPSPAKKTVSACKKAGRKYCYRRCETEHTEIAEETWNHTRHCFKKAHKSYKHCMVAKNIIKSPYSSCNKWYIEQPHPEPIDFSTRKHLKCYHDCKHRVKEQCSAGCHSDAPSDHKQKAWNHCKKAGSKKLHKCLYL